MALRQQRERIAFKELYRAESRKIRARRAANKPSGLAAFLGRVTGVQLIRKKVHTYQDRRRHRRFLEIREELSADHQHERALLAKRHQLQALDFRRHECSLGALERKEKRSLELTLLRDSRVSEREGRSGESRDSVSVEFAKAAKQSLGQAFDEAKSESAQVVPVIDLANEFRKAVREEKEEEQQQGSSGGPNAKSKGSKVKSASEEKESSKRRRRRRRRRDRDIDRGR